MNKPIEAYYIISNKVNPKYIYKTNVYWNIKMRGRSTLFFKSDRDLEEAEIQDAIDDLSDRDLQDICDPSEAVHQETEVNLSFYDKIRVIAEHPKQQFLFKEIENIFKSDLYCNDTTFAKEIK